MTSCGTVTVVDPFDPSAVSLDCELSAHEVERGDSVDLELNLTNSNNATAVVDVDVRVDNTTVDTYSETVTTSNTFTVAVVLNDVGEKPIGAEIANVQEYNT